MAIAAGGIIVYKTTGARNIAAECGRGGFASSLDAIPAATTSNVRQPAGMATSIAAMSAIDAVAASLDTVFLLIPTKDNAPIAKDASAALAAVERALRAKGIRTGLFTLQTASPDYPGVAAKLLSVPGIVVLSKGRSNGAVSGEISEDSLMLAYVASTQRASCCPPGSPPCK